MDRFDREAAKLVRAERARAEREAEEIKRAADARIATIEQESRRRQKELETRLVQLKRDQENAVRTMQADMERSIVAQQKETRQQLERLKAETDRKIKAQAEEMQHRWKEVYSKLEQRIQQIAQKQRDIIEMERQHAREVLERARERLEKAKTNPALKRFNPSALNELIALFNGAIQEFNNGFAVPAEGQAHLLLFECTRCEEDANERGVRWEAYHREAMEQWQGLREQLDVMESCDEVVQAAELTLEGICLRLWNEPGCKEMNDQLEAVRGVLAQDPPCAMEEIGLQCVIMSGMDESIERVIVQARAQASRYLYLNRLLDEMGTQLLELYGDMVIVDQSTQAVANSGELLLEDEEDVERNIRVTVAPTRNPDVMIVHVLENTFDHQAKRWAKLEQMLKALGTALNGMNGPRMALSRISRYTEGESVGVVFDVNVGAGGGTFVIGEADPEGKTERPAEGRGKAKDRDGEVTVL